MLLRWRDITCRCYMMTITTDLCSCCQSLTCLLFSDLIWLLSTALYVCVLYRHSSTSVHIIFSYERIFNLYLFSVFHKYFATQTILSACLWSCHVDIMTLNMLMSIAVFCRSLFLPRDAMQARSMLSRSVCLSVCPFVRPSRSWITSKRINISSKFFYHQVATPF